MKNFEADEINRVPMKVAIGLMREAFQMLSEGSVKVPLRTVMETEDKSGLSLFMPSYAPAWNLFGLKMVTVFPGNQPPNPVIQGKMILMDAVHGQPLATLDAASLTALRTGAASGLATELLSRPNSSSLAIFGTGAQARTQVAGVVAVRKITRILVKGTTPKKEEDFCRLISEEYAIPCESLAAPENLREVDVVCTATTSAVPLFKLAHLKPGTHINAVGSYKPHLRELSEEVIRSCRLVVDQRAAVLHEAGELAIPIQEGTLTPDSIYAELGEIVAGKAGRQSDQELTVFKSVGNAVQDLAVARYLSDNECRA
ncbi:MAG: ornithine cyclodeaminase [Cyclobacteriaceae bacterium]|nr:ornithine cyclodeaminase [Cyclobacteriaceae bacterium]